MDKAVKTFVAVLVALMPLMAGAQESVGDLHARGVAIYCKHFPDSELCGTRDKEFCGDALSSFRSMTNAAYWFVTHGMEQDAKVAMGLARRAEKRAYKTCGDTASTERALNDIKEEEKKRILDSL